MIDLHVHSIISDGMDTPTEIVRKAKKLGLEAITLTDHDCIDGLKEASIEADRIGITFVKGIELSVLYGEKRIIHILGLGINPEEENFKNAYKAYRKSRHKQVTHIIKALNKINIFPDMKQLITLSTDGFLDRLTVARWLLKSGVTKSMSASWIDYLDHIPYREGELIDVVTALNMIKSAGGKSFMAHYHKPIGLKGYTKAECDKRLTELKSLGLDGLEYYYPDYVAENYNELDIYIKKYDFIKSGGTDYHGSNRPGVELGSGNGNLSIPVELLENIGLV